MVADADSADTNYSASALHMTLPPNLLSPIDLWSKENVQQWIEYCVEEYSLADIPLNNFKMNGKALLLLNEDGFKQRSSRSGDILYKALQLHQTFIKSFHCPTFPYQFWQQFPLLSSSSSQRFHIPILPPAMTYTHPTFNYSFHHPERTLDERCYVHSPVKHTIPLVSVTQIKQEPTDNDSAVPTPPITASSSSNSPLLTESSVQTSFKQHAKESLNIDRKSTTRQIRYYHDRIDFYGEILMKPQAAKNCRILWEFLYILLEDSHYQSIIIWENRPKMIFRIVQADKLAALWGLQKNRLTMTYEKLSRGMRYYYSNNIISKEQSKRLLYRFMRSPEEIRKSMKRSSDVNTLNYEPVHKQSSFPSLTSSTYLHDSFLQLFSAYQSSSSNGQKTSISKSDRSSSSSPESFDSEKHSYASSLERQPAVPPLNLVLSKENPALSSV